MEKSKAIFIHLPRTAGTSIRHDLMRTMNVKFLWPFGWQKTFPGQDLNLGEVPRRGHSNPGRAFIEKHPDAFSFCFIRNPWERMVSTWRTNLYSFKHKVPFTGRKGYYKQIKPLVEKGSFTEFVRVAVKSFLGPQILVFTDDKGVLVDFVGRYEDLERDFSHICDTLGVRTELSVQHSDNTNRLPFFTKAGEYRKFYTDETEKIVSEMDKGVIMRFNYSF